MKYDITKNPWYQKLVEKCNKESNKTHSIFIENAFLSEEEFYHQLNDYISQLDLLPKNAHVFVNWDGDIIDITIYRQPEVSQEERANFMKQMEERFKIIDLSKSTDFIHKTR